MTKYEILRAEEIKTSLLKYSNRNISEIESLAKNTAENDYVSGNLTPKSILKCLAISLKDFMDCLGGLNKSHGAKYTLAKRLFVVNYLNQTNRIFKHI